MEKWEDKLLEDFRVVLHEHPRTESLAFLLQRGPLEINIPARNEEHPADVQPEIEPMEIENTAQKEERADVSPVIESMEAANSAPGDNDNVQNDAMGKPNDDMMEIDTYDSATATIEQTRTTETIANWGIVSDESSIGDPLMDVDEARTIATVGSGESSNAQNLVVALAQQLVLPHERCLIDNIPLEPAVPARIGSRRVSTAGGRMFTVNNSIFEFGYDYMQRIFVAGLIRNRFDPFQRQPNQLRRRARSTDLLRRLENIEESGGEE